MPKWHQQLGNVLDGSVSFEPSTISKTILNLPFQVGYASLAKLLVPYASKDGATPQVLSRLMTFRHLHSVIREANGAYGGGLNYDGLGGTLNYYPTDPNAIKSASAFETSAQAARAISPKVNGTRRRCRKPSWPLFQSVDAPGNISSEGAVPSMASATT
ncbi:hypothetical protein JCM33374_g2496 [Metschnikowia sp. JCM 33374]|nr:hypothetical protein JCM33374_g2496 [Metschnikowia sp. JCM 33374]